MSARAKLNAAYMTGAVLVAAIVGASAQSWAVFFVTSVVLIAGSWIAGEIRPNSEKSRNR